MPDAFSTAAKGKGFAPMLARMATITQHYGLSPKKIDRAFSSLSGVLASFSKQGTIPVTAAALARNKGVVIKYCQQGIELAIHGLVHVDYSKLPVETQVNHLERALQVFSEAGVGVSGFRSPYLRWNADTLAAIRRVGLQYDSSQALAWKAPGGINTEAYERVLEFYGTQDFAQVPALPRLDDGLVRIPYCLPDDEALLDRMHLHGRDELAGMWLSMLDQTHQSGELFTLGLHPERAAICSGALAAVLDKALSYSPPIWIARLDEISAWYRSFGSVTFQLERNVDLSYQISIQAQPQANVLARSILVAGSSAGSSNTFQRLPSPPFTFACSQCPIIGLSPACPPILRNFLVHQGFLVETGTQSQDYTFYLDRTSFSIEDERKLLSEIETGNWPLIRLGRWPNGCQSALAITGDLDALTLWDYGLRFFEQ